jgi:hypothetical protein
MTESPGHGPESPAETEDFVSRPESPATGARVSGWTQDPEPWRDIDHIGGKNYNKVSRKMKDNH